MKKESEKDEEKEIEENEQIKSDTKKIEIDCEQDIFEGI